MKQFIHPETDPKENMRLAIEGTLRCFRAKDKLEPLDDPSTLKLEPAQDPATLELKPAQDPTTAKLT